MINYIKKQKDNQLCISKNDETIIKNISIKKYINRLLKKQLTNLLTREKQTKINLNFKSKIPLYIDGSNLFLCMRSYRLEESFYINYYSILSYEYLSDFVIVKFKSKQSIKIPSKHTFKSQLKKCSMIIDYIT